MLYIRLNIRAYNLSEGVEPGKIAHKIGERTGMGYTWVMKYLPDKFKDHVKSESAHATRRVAD